MPSHQDMINLLRTGPVLQAMVAAETAATDTIQTRMLDAVLTDDHRAVSRPLEEEDHSRLLDDDFFMPLSILVIGQAHPHVVKTFVDQGYTAKDRPVNSPTITTTMGEIALAICDTRKIDILIQVGFMKPSQWACDGMKDGRPDIFDFWLEQHRKDYIQSKRQASATRMLRKEAAM